VRIGHLLQPAWTEIRQGPAHGPPSGGRIWKQGSAGQFYFSYFS